MPDPSCGTPRHCDIADPPEVGPGQWQGNTEDGQATEDYPDTPSPSLRSYPAHAVGSAAATPDCPHCQYPNPPPGESLCHTCQTFVNEFRGRVAQVHGGSRRGRRPNPAASVADRNLFKRMDQALENVDQHDSLHSGFWSLLSSTTDAAKAGLEFTKTMNKVSQDGRSVATAKAPRDATTRPRGSDRERRHTLAKLITNISASQKIMQKRALS